MELQSRYEDLQDRGLGLAVVTYDPTTTLSQFAAARGIAFPLLSDEGSATIRQYGLLNEEMGPGACTGGAARADAAAVRDPLSGHVHARSGRPGDRALLRGGLSGAFHGVPASPSGSGTRRRVRPGPRRASRPITLEALAWTTDDTVAPGNRLSLVVDVTPKPDMHVYAPGDHAYRVIRLRTTAPDFLRGHEVTYPQSGMYRFEPLDETVPVYEEAFRLVQDVTIPMRQDIAELASRAGRYRARRGGAGVPGVRPRGVLPAAGRCR